MSGGPWAGLDLALHVGDDPGSVARNRDLLARWAGAAVRFPNQVHGRDVLVISPSAPGTAAPERAAPEGDPPGRAATEGTMPGCDAVVTAGPGLAVGVLVADCVPVLLADPGAGVVGAAHAGRRGLLAGVLQEAVAAMCGLGARPERIHAAIGPAAGACCYEVPEAMRDEAAARWPQLWAWTRQGTPSLDLPGGCRAALADAGVRQVIAVPICTIDDEAYYSYRRAGNHGSVTGRFAGVVGIAS